MTPTIISKEILLLNNKMRKLFLEKMQRDRIKSSSSVFWLQSSLKQQPDFKLEKAEILEMTLNFMQRHNFSSHAVNSGFSMCEQNRRESARPEDLQQRHECQQERHLKALVEP
ncbi:transcription factor HES-5-like protein [Labeo rohita]|uniref:Transcription factor HES-5-like protein n=1 Tax=Labeo rohita TaxID=84645 RepID=A0A498NZH2_LABRO|nr:transcription factor HES-5-like protein [Labeo rohita]